MIDDNLTADESDNLFDGGIKFFKSNETNSFHSVEPVVASDEDRDEDGDQDDEDAEEKDDLDKLGGPYDVQEAGEHTTCTPRGEKLKKGHHSFLTQTTVDNSARSDNELSEYKNIILTLKKINESVDSAFDCNIVNLFVEEQGKQRIVKKKKKKKKKEPQKEQKKIVKVGTGKKKITPLREQVEKKKKNILNALLPLDSCKICIKRCNTRAERIGQLPDKYRSIGGVEQFTREIKLSRARCVSGRRHHDFNASLEGEISEGAAEIKEVIEVEGQRTRNSLSRKEEQSETKEGAHDRGNHLLSASHFIGKANNRRESSPSCTQGFSSITCSMTSNAGGSSTAQGGIEAVEQVSQHAGVDDGGEENRPCSEDTEGLADMKEENFVGGKKLSDVEEGELNRTFCGINDDSNQNFKGNGHVEMTCRKNSAPFLQSSPCHDLSENYFAVYSSKKSTEGCHTGRGKSERLEDTVKDRDEDHVEHSEEKITPFCAPPSCLDKRLDGGDFPFLCYYGCGKDALEHRWRQRQRNWSVQNEKTMEKRITIRGRVKSVPGEYTSSRIISSGTHIPNIANMQKEKIVEGMKPCDMEVENHSKNQFYDWNNNNYRDGCVTNGRLLPKFKSLSNDMEEAHNDGMHFINASMLQSNRHNASRALRSGVYLCESSVMKEKLYVGKLQGRVLSPWEDTRTGGQIADVYGDDGEVYKKEGVERIPFFPPSIRMYNPDDMKNDHPIVSGGYSRVVPPFKELKVNYRSSRNLSWRSGGAYGQQCQLQMNVEEMDAGEEDQGSKVRRGFHVEKEIFFEAIKNIIRIMKEIKKIKTNLKIERNYCLVIQDKKKKNELKKLIEYLTYQKEVRKKLKKHYFDKINKGLFTFLLRSNRVNFFFTEEEVKLLKRWNEIKYTRMSSSSGGNTEGEGGKTEGGKTSCFGRSGSYVKGGSPYRRKILYELKHLNNVIGQKGDIQQEANGGDEYMWDKGKDETLWTNWGDSQGEGTYPKGKQKMRKSAKDFIRRVYLGNTPSCPIFYELYFTHCEKSQRDIFNIFLCLKNVKRKGISQKFKRKIKNGQIYLSKIYDGARILSHVKYILVELLRRNVPEIICLHINDCFIDATISFFISLLLLLFKNVNTIKVIRCQIYYSYLSVFLSYQKRNNLRRMYFVCNSIFWTRPPDFRNFPREVHSPSHKDNYLLYFNTNYVKRRKRKGLSNLRIDNVTRQQCGYEDSTESSLKRFFEGRASLANGAATGDYRIVVKRKKKVARFGVDEFYDCFVLGKKGNVRGDANVEGDENVEGDANVGGDTNVEGDANVEGDENVGEEPNSVDNKRMMLKTSVNELNNPTNAYNIHSGSGSDENTSEDSLKEELHECLCTFPRKRIQQANFSMLKKLKLCSNKLNDDALMYICTLIKKDKLKNLKVLDLRWNNFTYRSLLALSLALTNTTVCEGSEKIQWKRRKLQKLLLSGNNIKSSLYSSFLSSFCTCNFIVVKKLDFSMNVIDNDSFPITLKYFKHIFNLQKRKQKKKKKKNIGDGDIFINLDHNNLKNSPYINKLEHLLKKFPSTTCKLNSENQTPAKEPNSVVEDSPRGVLLSLQYNNIKRGTWCEDPAWGTSTSRIKF
ncbi:conserved Plasmodium protein, unknown function [Plasmodium knowlesi strain H]|uniref:Leucine-rich repeat protein n=3 Tax=Plasmodium knowlesi TaxID=5850 RepID=B3L3Z0_PLAKH|nr:conserved Plasmodium protein, unknown function [Plasmodium knowlesi strain H]OTN65978.1 Uncharacterized protein PKNOH_S100047800 [Plasmodium knowlesi]CAA9987840.1 conserved Plasmodium protein, unknown function [Plasmodium knowlesi strain H]SBO22338.1 conserved Plasmodium protein, unknown function [Plasmodium knowlesi strain H]VVS77314.1 conserved Plasmodium protein, unknown function [Plasmodium knowlesi strain H]|eukprot:XP_002258838.1 hypothetical protein, conserved in Plasmodium species [Plasmodium knowlesi strain H]